jgi:hypothetical protein
VTVPAIEAIVREQGIAPVRGIDRAGIGPAQAIVAKVPAIGPKVAAIVRRLQTAPAAVRPIAPVVAIAAAQ